MKTSKINFYDFISGIVLACAGLYLMFGKNVIVGKTFGVDSMPMVARADFYIRALGTALFFLAILLAARSLRSAETKQKQPIPLVAILSAAALLVFNLALTTFGFFVCAVLLITFWTFLFRIKEYHIHLKQDKRAALQSALISLVFSVISVTVLQLAFTRLLGVRLPT